MTQNVGCFSTSTYVDRVNLGQTHPLVLFDYLASRASTQYA